ncbi:MAG: hypothetical protein NT144_12825 [Bacteroidia bacterium]|nr:hypothetical protein [Bacteroidia bacterium]
MLIKIYNDIVNFLSFAGNLRALRTKINISIDLPEVIAEFPDSHPRGFIKEFKKRRTTIVETYLKITNSLDSASYNQRIHALSLLAEHIIYSRTLKMPLNAARVQLALMKEVVKNRDNKRVQLELMRDFTVSSFGHPRTIRHFLKKLDIIEVPETGEELKDLKMGWDFHVHDNTSYGRKLPTQLIIDAFIKGISELTIVYNNLDREEAVKEVLEAGRILGIKVNIALEFSALTNGLRYHYMYILPNFSSKKEKFKKFLKERTDNFKEFLDELEENEKKREKNIEQLIENFNNVHLPQINEGYIPNSIYYLQPISINGEESTFNHKIYSRRQLGEFLFPKLKSVLEKRALQITALQIQTEKSPSLFTEQEIESIKTRYREIRMQFRNLEPEKIRLEYFTGNELLVSETAVSSLEDIYFLARKSGGNIKFIQPLEHGLQAAIDKIFENFKMLSYTEIYNIYDSIETKESDFVIFANFIRLLNGGDQISLINFLNRNELQFDQKRLEKTLEYFKHNKLIPAIGSDAAGRSTLAPGMGFVLENRITKHQRKHFAKNHYMLPDEISDLIFELARFPKNPLKKGERPTIICLGKLDNGKQNMLGDEKIEKPINPLRAWEYLNPAIKYFIFILIGFIPAYFTVGMEYALLWFAITGSRNMFVDVISGNGFSPREWHSYDINWSNFANSLFWTGFSVPILGFVKARFDIAWTGPHEGTLFEIFKFFCINISNGIYLASHNYLRGFDKGTIRGNFFRSILAWPLAVVFSPLGNALLLPSIVQAKFWSDFVAAIIEGTGKYKNIIRLKDRIMKKLLPDLISEDDETEKLAMLDMIYFVNESTRAKTALKKQLIPRQSLFRKLLNCFKWKKERIVPNKSYFELIKRMDHRNRFNELINYIIEHYNREQSLFLLKLVSENYYKLQKWLQRID